MTMLSALHCMRCSDQPTPLSLFSHVQHSPDLVQCRKQPGVGKFHAFIIGSYLGRRTHGYCTHKNVAIHSDFQESGTYQSSEQGMQPSGQWQGFLFSICRESVYRIHLQQCNQGYGDLSDTSCACPQIRQGVLCIRVKYVLFQAFVSSCISLQTSVS